MALEAPFPALQFPIPWKAESVFLFFLSLSTRFILLPFLVHLPLPLISLPCWPPPYLSSPLLSSSIFHALSLPLDLWSPFLRCLISFIALSSLSFFHCRVVPSRAPSSLECSGIKCISLRGVKHFPLARSRLQFGSPYVFCRKQCVSSLLIPSWPWIFRCSAFSFAYHCRNRRREHSRSPVAGPSPYSFSRERKGGSCSLLPVLVYFPLSFANSFFEFRFSIQQLRKQLGHRLQVHRVARGRRGHLGLWKKCRLSVD